MITWGKKGRLQNKLFKGQWSTYIDYLENCRKCKPLSLFRYKQVNWKRCYNINNKKPKLFKYAVVQVENNHCDNELL